MREEVIAKILEEKIIAIVRGVGAEECMKVAQALYEGGIRLMEITFDQKNPASFQATAGAIRAIGEAYAGKMMVGAGTVTTPELVELGLSVPEVTKIFLRLREMGLDIDTDVYTVKYAVKTILAARAAAKEGM